MKNTTFGELDEFMVNIFKPVPIHNIVNDAVYRSLPSKLRIYLQLRYPNLITVNNTLKELTYESPLLDYKIQLIIVDRSKIEVSDRTDRFIKHKYLKDFLLSNGEPVRLIIASSDLLIDISSSENYDPECDTFKFGCALLLETVSNITSHYNQLIIYDGIGRVAYHAFPLLFINWLKVTFMISSPEMIMKIVKSLNIGVVSLCIEENIKDYQDMVTSLLITDLLDNSYIAGDDRIIERDLVYREEQKKKSDNDGRDDKAD